MPGNPDPSLPPDGESFDVESASLRYLDGKITGAELARLNSSLLSSQETRRKFVRLCVQACQLREIFAQRKGLELADLGGQAHEAELDASLSRQAAAHRGADRRAASQFLASSWPRRAIAIAAIVLISTIVLVSILARERRELVPGMSQDAALTSQFDATWEGAAPSIGALLPAAQMHLESGYAVVQFKNGASVVVQGPARFTHRGGGMDLSDGRLSALIPPAAQPFSIHTAGAEIVDLGTEFGINAHADGDTQVQVFQGRVSVKALDAATPLPPDVVPAANGRRISGGVVSVVPYDASSLVRIGQVDKWIAAQSAEPFERWKAWSERVCLDPDLKAYYSFNTYWSSGLVPNLAPSGRTLDGHLVGTGTRPSQTAGRWPTKGAIQFHALSNQRMVLGFEQGGDPLDFSGGSGLAKPFSIAVWVKGAPSQVDSAPLISRGFEGSEQYAIDVYGGKFRAFVRDVPGYGTLGYTAQSRIAPNGRWQYIVATCSPDQGTLSLYVDGALAGENSSAPNRLIAAQTAVSVGSRPAYGLKSSYTLDGAVDEIVVWGNVLSPERILENYEAGKPG